MIKIIYVNLESVHVEVYVSQPLLRDVIEALVAAGCKVIEVKE